MPAHTRPIVSFALKTLTSAVASTMLLAASANAAGLGKLTVLSSLGQPLRAEIELTSVTPDEAGAVVAKLAPTDAFRAANIDFNPALLSLRFDVDARNGRQLIRISSSQPINEPFVDMLLELSWTGGRMVREYTFLLDPAEMRTTQSPQAAAPVDVFANRAQPAPRAATPAPAAAPAPMATPAPSAPPAMQATPVPAPATAKAAAGEYTVKAGDNLTKIANQVKPVDVSLDMMLVALYRANPEAFSGNNMNRLKSGQILSVPDADAIRNATNEGEARGVVVAHAADFSAYRAKLAGQVATSAPAKEPEATQSTSGKISAKVEERPTAVTESKDQLKLSKANPNATGAGKTGQAAVEDKIAQQKASAEAAARVKELEKNVSDLEKLMAVKNKAAADLKKASASASASAAASAPVIDLNAAPSASAEAKAPVKPKRSLVVPKSVVEPSMMDTLMDNIKPIGIGLAAVLAGVGGLLAARRRKEKQEAEQRVEATSSLLGVDTGTQAQSLVSEAGGQSVDTNNSVFNSNFAPSASQLDTNEVDPVAEADVYIAYGRDAQAEEILKEALRTHPDRAPVRLKLLEIYANRKDARAFETQASELYSQTRGQGDEWAQAAAMGAALDPSNPLYSSGGAASAAAGAAAMDPSMFAPPPEPMADFAAAPAPAAADAGGLDLDLSQDLGAALAPTPAPADNGMDFTSKEETALPSLSDFSPSDFAPAPAPSTADLAAAADADQFLDFDLGGLSLDSPASAPAPAPAPAAEAKPEESMFDLSFDPVPQASAPAPAPEAAPLEDLSMDFGLDLPAEKVAEAPASLPTVGSDPLAALDLMDFDIPEVPAIQAKETPALSADDFADSLELQGQGASPAPTPAAAPAEFDLSGIDLDLGGDTATATAAETRPAAAPEAMSAHHMEMDTKLDLAIAYQEIGDKEGARELLDEVIRGGSDDQVAKANAMKAQLG